MIPGGGYGFGRSLASHGYGFGIGEVTHHHGGGIDKRRKHKSIFKPTGLLNKKKLDVLVEEQQKVVEEVMNAISPVKDYQDIVELPQKNISLMSLAEIDLEIKTILHKKYRTQEDEVMLVMMMAALL